MPNLLFVLALLLPLQSQTLSPKCSLTGRILDLSSSQPIIGATVSLLTTQFGAATDAHGRFTVSNLPAGIYKVKIAYIGFHTIVLDSVSVVPGSPTNIELNLRPQTSVQDVVTIVVREPDFKMNYVRPDSTIDFRIRIFNPNKLPQARSDSVIIKNK